MGKIICPECGAEVEQIKFCTECGHLLKKTSENKVETSNDSTNNQSSLFAGIRGMVLSRNSSATKDAKDESEEKSDKRHNTSVSDAELTLLVDYCKKTVATVGGDGYSESVLYQRAENEYEVHVYSKYEYMKEETHYAYKCDKSVLYQVMKYIDEKRLASYENARGIGLCGAMYIVKFLKNEKIYRITTDNLGEEGSNILYRVGEILSEAVTSENELK